MEKHGAEYEQAEKDTPKPQEIFGTPILPAQAEIRGGEYNNKNEIYEGSDIFSANGIDPHYKVGRPKDTEVLLANWQQEWQQHHENRLRKTKELHLMILKQRQDSWKKWRRHIQLMEQCDKQQRQNSLTVVKKEKENWFYRFMDYWLEKSQQPSTWTKVPEAEETEKPINRINPVKCAESRPMPSKLRNESWKPLNSIANTPQPQPNNSTKKRPT